VPSLNRNKHMDGLAGGDASPQKTLLRPPPAEKKAKRTPEIGGSNVAAGGGPSQGECQARNTNNCDSSASLHRKELLEKFYSGSSVMGHSPMIRPKDCLDTGDPVIRYHNVLVIEGKHLRGYKERSPSTEGAHKAPPTEKADPMVLLG